MSKSRYADTPILDGNHYATWSIPVYAKGYRSLDLLKGVQTQEYIWKKGDRFDKLAAQYFHDDQYWWVICICNDVLYPFGIAPDTVFRIPLDHRDILSKLLR